MFQTYIVNFVQGLCAIRGKRINHSKIPLAGTLQMLQEGNDF